MNFTNFTNFMNFTNFINFIKFLPFAEFLEFIKCMIGTLDCHLRLKITPGGYDRVKCNADGIGKQRKYPLEGDSGDRGPDLIRQSVREVDRGRVQRCAHRVCDISACGLSG